jgi:succinate-semialdehyde dehydrogenase/glutarate-semialdehyde dehydrogenase
VSELASNLVLDDPTLLRDQCLVGGEWISASETIEVRNPATQQLLARVPRLGGDATRTAIERANRALPAWRRLTAKSRAQILRRWCDLMLTHREDLSRIMTAEQGKPLAEARGEIAYAASFLEWFAEEGKRVYGETIPAPAEGQRIVVLKEAIGVCAAITPWNFPAAMIARKAGPALAAGCTMVLKPASQTPLSALALAVLAERAGVPPGVFSVVTGAASQIGSELCNNPLVRKLSFTGSTEIGRQLMAQTAATVKKVSMELGGNAPFIVFEDADLDRAVEGAIASKFRNAGQTCVCTNRIYVHRMIYDEFSQRLAAAVQALRIGDGSAEGVSIGPLIDESAVRKVEEHIEDALRHGATVLAGGRRHGLGGTFFEPTVLGGVTHEMAVAREETFGPVAPLFPFDSEEEVLANANDTEFGLASYFYTRNLGRAWRVAEALEHGMVGVNTGLISNEVAPFGGIKQSGVGREGSRHGIDEYLTIKYVNFAGLASAQ